MRVEPYLNFRWTLCRSDEFYKKALGRRSADGHEIRRASGLVRGMAPPADKVMHSSMKIGDWLSCAPTANAKAVKSSATSLSLTVANDAEADRASPREQRRPSLRASKRNALFVKVRHGYRQVRRAVDGRRRTERGEEHSIPAGRRFAERKHFRLCFLCGLCGESIFGVHMKYMLLIYMAENAIDNDKHEQCYKDSTALCQDLNKAGQFLGASPSPVATATSVRVREGKRLITDGPFAETREQLGGFFMIHAPDLDAALAIAARIPGAKKGTVEVRPVVEIPNLPG